MGDTNMAFIKLDPIDGLEHVADPLTGKVLYADGGTMKTTDLSVIKSYLAAGIVGSLKTTDTKPLPEDVGKYELSDVGTYANLVPIVAVGASSPSSTPIVTESTYINSVYWDGINFTQLRAAMPQATQYIPAFEGSTFPIVGPAQRKHNSGFWEIPLGVSALANDVPGVSTKWKSLNSTEILEKTNLYDGSFIPGQFIASNGDITPGIGWGYVRIPASQLSAYLLYGFVGMSIMVRYEGVSNNLLSAQGFFAPPSRGITTPANCAFFCFNVKHPDFPNEYLNIKVNKGSVIITEPLKIKADLAPLFNGSTAKKSKWDGLTIDFLGDSIVAGGTYGSWVPEVGTLLGANVRNWGSSGAQAKRLVEIINGTGGWNAAYQHYGNNGVPNFTNTSAVCFMIGHNENMNTIGSIADIDNKIQSQYADTMVGNLAKAIEIILSQNINCKIYICTLHKNIGYVEQAELNWTRSPQNSAKLIELANYLGLTVIDVLNESGINKKNISVMTYDQLHLFTQGNKYVARCVATGLAYK